MIEIAKFSELLEPFLQLQDKSMKVASYKTENLVAAGENYGSVILAVEVLLTNGRRIPLVAKLNPPSDTFKKIFNIPIAFKKEAEFYEIIVPMLNNFQEKYNVGILDSFAKYYGSRYSLQSNKDTFDDDACLLMENVMFDAHLPLNLTDPEINAAHAKKIEALTRKFLLKDAKTALVAEEVITLMKHTIKQYLQMKVMGSEPFNTITHNDIWKSNIMLKFKYGKPVANRLVDFQMAAYGNPANDVLFFIYSSASADDITNHYNRLVQCYYQEFIKKLREFNVNIEIFSWEAFSHEMNYAAKNLQLYHILFMIVTAFINVKEGAKAEKTFNDDLASMLDESYLKHLKAVVMSYIKNGWI